MSANLVVDIGNTCVTQASLGGDAGVNETPASGVIVGEPVDLQYANTHCNVFAAGGGQALSGQFQVQVQTSPDTTSGNFTDPMSGLPANAVQPPWLSGAIMVCNSGTLGSNNFLSGVGGIQFGAFQRPHRYARILVLSGDSYNAPVVAGFVSQKRITGSGGGFTLAPGSGTVSV